MHMTYSYKNTKLSVNIRKSNSEHTQVLTDFLLHCCNQKWIRNTSSHLLTYCFNSALL